MLITMDLQNVTHILQMLPLWEQIARTNPSVVSLRLILSLNAYSDNHSSANFLIWGVEVQGMICHKALYVGLVV